MTHTQDDASTIARVQAGEQEAFRILVERYSGLVYHIAYSMCHHPDNAQEVVQEVFYRAFKAIGSYNPKWPFKAWLRRITVNYLLDDYKKKRVDTVSMTTETNETIEFPDHSFHPGNQFIESEQVDLLYQAIEALPEKERMAITLRHLQELSYEDIAEAMGIPLGTVMTQIHRGRKRLAERLAHLKDELYPGCTE